MNRGPRAPGVGTRGPTVASNERSLSKLKLLKTYLRAAICLICLMIGCLSLSYLGILSIEWYRFSEIGKREVLEMFAQRKAHKVNIV